MEYRVLNVAKGDRNRAARENKYTLNSGGEIRRSDALVDDVRKYHSGSINQVDLGSAINDSDRSSGLDVAPEEAEMKELPGSSAVYTPNVANDISESSSTGESVISASEKRSCHDEGSVTNSNSPTPQSHEAEHTQSEDKKRKGLAIDGEVGNPAKKKRASQQADASNSGSEAGGCYTTPDQDNNLESPVAVKAELSRKELLQLKRFDMVSNRLKKTIALAEGRTMLPKDVVEYREMIEVMETKYRKKEEPTKSNPSPRPCKHPTSINEFNKRLQGTEEKEHPWARTLEDPDTPPLVMRVWDERSQCQIKDPRTGFLAGSPSRMLNTYNARQLALEQHADWGNRFKTPFISTTNSLQEIVKTRVPYFQRRQRVKCIRENTRLSLINTRVRLAAGKPVLRMKKELLHYDVRTKSGELRAHDGIFFRNEYLLPYSCGPDEIVGTWAWRKIEKWMLAEKSDFEGWFERVGMVAFNEHEKNRLSRGT